VRGLGNNPMEGGRGGGGFCGFPLATKYLLLSSLLGRRPRGVTLHALFLRPAPGSAKINNADACLVSICFSSPAGPQPPRPARGNRPLGGCGGFFC
jgi:hypothetical protein